ncbi:MAG: hypothetical protein ACRD0P_18730 [Stackebrandtia sp.]
MIERYRGEWRPGDGDPAEWMRAVCRRFIPSGVDTLYRMPSTVTDPYHVVPIGLRMAEAAREASQGETVGIDAVVNGDQVTFIRDWDRMAMGWYTRDAGFTWPHDDTYIDDSDSFRDWARRLLRLLGYDRTAAAPRYFRYPARLRQRVELRGNRLRLSVRHPDGIETDVEMDLCDLGDQFDVLQDPLVLVPRPIGGLGELLSWCTEVEHHVDDAIDCDSGFDFDRDAPVDPKLVAYVDKIVALPPGSGVLRTGMSLHSPNWRSQRRFDLGIVPMEYQVGLLLKAADGGCGLDGLGQWLDGVDEWWWRPNLGWTVAPADGVATGGTESFTSNTSTVARILTDRGVTGRAFLSGVDVNNDILIVDGLHQAGTPLRLSAG